MLVERDAETGLDWFESRYYSSAQGRFTSPDEFKGGFLDAFTGQAAFQPGPLPYADIGDPQTLNKYAYVRNNPLRYTDPNGHCVEDLCIGEAILAYTAATAVAGGAIYYAQRLGTAIGDFFSAKRSDREVTPPANPNKPGTRGKEDHQKTANEEADRVNGDREVRIPTPGGKKDTRVADAVGTNPQTGQPEIVQVVRPTKTGGVPKRETDAATDIEKPGSSPLLFLCDQQHRLDRQSLRCLDKTKSNIWATKYNFICFPTMQAHSLPSLRALRPL